MHDILLPRPSDKPDLEPGLELESGHEIGRDPRDMTPTELRAAGHEPIPPLKAIRAHCLDCCNASPGEVRRCTAVRCPSWPFRLGADPWRVPVVTPAQRAARRANAARINAARKNPIRGTSKITKSTEGEGQTAGAEVVALVTTRREL